MKKTMKSTDFEGIIEVHTSCEDTVNYYVGQKIKMKNDYYHRYDNGYEEKNLIILAGIYEIVEIERYPKLFNLAIIHLQTKVRFNSDETIRISRQYTFKGVKLKQILKPYIQNNCLILPQNQPITATDKSKPYQEEIMAGTYLILFWKDDNELTIRRKFHSENKQSLMNKEKQLVLN